MPVFAAKDRLSDVIGLKNDIVFKVFTCPDCKTDVTISRYQVEGSLPVICARCNCRYTVKGEQILDENPAKKDYFIERWDQKTNQSVKQDTGYKVFMKLDATQKATALPKDSFTLVMKPHLAAPKPAPAAPKPAGAVPVAGAAAPAAAAPKPIAPAAPAAAPEAPKPAEGGAA